MNGWAECPQVLPPFVPGQAHLWNIEPSHRFSESLNAREKERWSRIQSEKTRRDFATSQGGLRSILSRYLACSAQDISMRRQAGGKPYVEPGPHFNLSHTAGLTIAVFAGQEVGIDLEKADRRVSADGIARKFFTPEEVKSLNSVRPEERAAYFLRLWVCKEASVKLSGEGIAFGLRKVSVDLHSQPVPMALYEGRQVHLWEFQPAPGFLGAVASWTPCRANCFYRL